MVVTTPLFNLYCYITFLRARRVDAELNPVRSGKEIVEKALGTVRATLATVRARLATFLL